MKKGDVVLVLVRGGLDLKFVGIGIAVEVC